MAAFNARLTSAGLFGEVEITTSNGTVNLRGLFVSSKLVRWRSIIQWALAAATVPGIFFLGEEALWFLAAAFVFSFVAYLAFWWIATEHTVTIAPGADTEASIGWSSHPLDALRLLHWRTLISLVFDMASTGQRTVSFVGPSPSTGSAKVRYVALAHDARDAAALNAALRGLAGLPGAARSGAAPLLQRVGQVSEPSPGKGALPVYKVDQTAAEMFGVECPECKASEHVMVLWAETRGKGEKGQSAFKARCNACGKELTGVLDQQKAERLDEIASIVTKD